MNLRYNKENDTFERVEPFTVDSIQEQINTWKRDIENSNSQIKVLLGQIDRLEELKAERAASLGQ